MPKYEKSPVTSFNQRDLVFGHLAEDLGHKFVDEELPQGGSDGGAISNCQKDYGQNYEEK